jgi:hypothetical protein
MSRTITKFLFAVALLFGLLNTVLAADYTGKYKATMKFGESASGSSSDVDATINYNDDGTYDLTFIGFDVTINLMIQQSTVTNGTATVSKLKGEEGSNGLTLTETSNSDLEIADQTLSVTKFNATIDNEGNGQGSFTGTFMMIKASCEFTLAKVVDTDTIVSKEIELDNVPFYNKVVDLSKGDDTTKTNNDASAVGIRLYEKKASFTMTDYEISVAGLSLKQRMVLENLKYTTDGSSYQISGETQMYVDQHKLYVPAQANITVDQNGKIDGTVDISLDMPLVKLNYKITVVLGKAAEGVVIEKKDLEYTKTDSFKIKSDSAFVLDSKIYINEEGILIENIHYSIVEQTMTLLIKDYEIRQTTCDCPRWENPRIYIANKAEAYITVNGQAVYLKDVDIDLNLKEAETSLLGHLTIVDGGSGRNNFIDIEKPFVVDSLIAFPINVDTTGNNLDGYDEDTEFFIGKGKVFDYGDGYMTTVKLKDLEATRKQAIQMIGAKSFDTYAIATDEAGNSIEIKVQCWPSVAPVYIEEETPKLPSYRVVADSLTGKATIKLEPLTIKYIAKNDSIGKTAIANQVVAEATIDGEKVEYMTPFELPVGKYEIKYVWSDPYKTGYQAEREATATITVYESMASYTGVSNVANKAVSVFYKDGNLVVNGANDADVKVISISGATVYTGKAGAINLHKGIYIVKVEGKAYKIIVK